MSGFVEHAVEGVAILLWAAEPQAPQRLATPFAVAAAAGALELPVEIYFTAASVQLLVPGVADALHASPRNDKSVLAWLQEAVAHGARLYACSDALQAQGLDRAALLSECSGHGGALQFAARAGDQRWRALVF